MAGIFGGISARSGERDIELMSSRMRLAAQQGFDHPFDSCTLGETFGGIAAPDHYGRGRYILRSDDGAYALLLFGEIILSDGTPLREHNFAAGFLKPFLSDPDALLLSLDGVYTFALLSANEVTLVNDPFGNSALHYATDGSGFYFGSQMEAIRSVIASAGIYERGLHELIGLGVTMNGRTPFEGISRLPSGCLLRATAKGYHLRHYIAARYHAEEEAVPQTLVTIHDAFRRSVRVRASYPGAIAALTGGFDSRVTWSVIREERLTLPAHTHGLPGSNDLRIASRISRALGIPHDTFVFDDRTLNSMSDLWKTIVEHSEGAISIAHAPTIAVWQSLTSRYRITLDSYGGAFYRRQRMKVAELRIDTSKDIVPQLWDFERSPLFASDLIKQDARTAIEQASLNALREYYDSLEDTPLLGDKLDRFHMEQIDAFKDALANNVQMNYVGVFHPLLCLPAYRAVQRLPIALRRRDAVHKYVVHQADPALERFALDNVGFTAPYSGFSTLRYPAMIADALLRKASGILPRASLPTLRRPTMDLEHLLRPGMPKLRDLAMTRTRTLDGMIDPEQVESALRRFEAGDLSVGHALLQLVSLVIFARWSETHRSS